MTAEAGAAAGRGRRLYLLLVLGGLSAVGALSVDMYLPALPTISSGFGTGPSLGQLTITSFAVGLGVAQLVVGPMSDRLGRRRPLVVGLVFYAVASVGCALAPSIGALVACRFVQGAAAGTGMVVARAVVRDLHSGVQLARYFSLLMLVIGVAPILAPSIGAQVLRVTSWRGIFYLLAAIGVALLVAVVAGLGETLPPERRHDVGPAALAATVGRLAHERVFMGYVLTLGFVNAAMFAYIAGAPFLFEDIHGVSAQAFGLIFGINAAGLIAASQIVRVVHSAQPARVLFGGVVVCCAGATAFLLVTALGLGLLAIVPSLFLVISSVGAVSSTVPALALADKADVAGAASGMIGASQLLFAAVAAPIVGVAGRHTAYPLAIEIAVLAWGAFAVLRSLTKPATVAITAELPVA